MREERPPRFQTAHTESFFASQHEILPRMKRLNRWGRKGSVTSARAHALLCSFALLFIWISPSCCLRVGEVIDHQSSAVKDRDLTLLAVGGVLVPEKRWRRKARESVPRRSKNGQPSPPPEWDSRKFEAFRECWSMIGYVRDQVRRFF